MRITPELKQWLIDNDHVVPQASDLTFKQTAARLLASGQLTTEQFAETSNMPNTPSPEKVFANNKGNVNVKAPSEQYSEQRYSVKHAKTGAPVFDPIAQRECLSMSTASKARHGVFLKHLARKAGIITEPATEHEEALLNEVCERQAWCGKIGSEFYDYVGGDRRVKALIDDATSGGLGIVPIEFDSDVISFPLLTGELLPHVDLKPVPRGRRIEGASISTPTMSWGGGDDTNINLFNTASMVAAIDTTIFTIDGAIEIGRDFLQDSPVEVGSVLTQLVGERLSSELDDVIGNGNGTTQPEGIFNASGVGTINTDNGNGGPPTLDDYISLLFALGKQYRNAAMRPTFISNDTTFQRSRSIAVDPSSPTTDQRPALAPLTEINNYRTLGWLHAVQNDIANAKCAIVAMAKYRLYRRLGLEIRFEQGGTTLARRNMVLMVYRARFGGRLMDANAAAKWTDGQS